jgi:hypothetical protein
MVRKTEKSIAPAAVQNLYHPACSPMTILTEYLGQNYKFSAANSDLFITISKILKIHIIIIIIIIIITTTTTTTTTTVFLYKYISRIFMVASCMLIILNPLFVQLMHTQIILKLLNY